jgi:hypothetical protein
MTRTLTTLLAITCASSVSFGKESKLTREVGALYLEDFLDKPLTLKVRKAAKTYSSLKGEFYLGTLRPDQEVTVLAISDRAYRVRGKAQQGDVAGWAGMSFFTKLEPEFIANLELAAKRHKQVKELIANKQVALGMTADEVSTALGKPTKRASKVDENGKIDTLEYITYDRVPQTRYVRGLYGQPIRQTYYVKVEIGRITVELTSGIVASVTESENNGRGNKGAIKIIPAPVFLF